MAVTEWVQDEADMADLRSEDVHAQAQARQPASIAAMTSLINQAQGTAENVLPMKYQVKQANLAHDLLARSAYCFAD